MKLLGFGRGKPKDDSGDESFDTEFDPVVFSQTELDALTPVLSNLDETVEIYEDDDRAEYNSQQEEERSLSTINTIGSKYWMNYLEEKENGDMTSPLSQNSCRSSFDTTVSNKPPGLPLSPRTQALLPKDGNLETTPLAGLKIIPTESREEQSKFDGIDDGEQPQQRDFSIETQEDTEKKTSPQSQATIDLVAAESSDESSQSLSTKSDASSELPSFSFNTAMLKRQKSGSSTPQSSTSTESPQQEKSDPPVGHDAPKSPMDTSTESPLEEKSDPPVEYSTLKSSTSTESPKEEKSDQLVEHSTLKSSTSTESPQQEKSDQLVEHSNPKSSTSTESPQQEKSDQLVEHSNPKSSTSAESPQQVKSDPPVEPPPAKDVIASPSETSLMKRVTNLLWNTRHIVEEKTETVDEASPAVNASVSQQDNEVEQKQPEGSKDQPEEEPLIEYNFHSPQNNETEQPAGTSRDPKSVDNDTLSEDTVESIEPKPEARTTSERTVSPPLSVKDLQRLGDMSRDESMYIEADSNSDSAGDTKPTKEKFTHKEPDRIYTKKQADLSFSEETQFHRRASKPDLNHIADSGEEESVYFESDSKSESQGDVSPTEQQIRLLKSGNAESQPFDEEHDDSLLLDSIVPTVQQVVDPVVTEMPPQKPQSLIQEPEMLQSNQERSTHHFAREDSRGAGPTREEKNAEDQSCIQDVGKVQSQLEIQHTKQEDEQPRVEIDTMNIISDDPYEWAYDVWERRGLMQNRKKRPRVSTRVEDIEQKTGRKDVKSEKRSEHSTASSRDVIITPRESFVELDFTGVQDDSPVLKHGRMSAPVASSKVVRTEKDRKSFANILQQWRACSDDKPNSHFLSPEQSFISNASNTSVERSGANDQSFSKTSESSMHSGHLNRPWQANIKKVVEPSGSDIEDHKIPATRKPEPAYAQVGGIAKASRNTEETEEVVTPPEEPAEKPVTQTVAAKDPVSHEVPAKMATSYREQAKFQRTMRRFEPKQQIEVASSASSKEYPSQAAKLKESMKRYDAERRPWRQSIGRARNPLPQSHRAKSAPRMGGAMVNERAKSPQAHFQRQKSPPKSRGDYKSVVQAVLSDVNEEGQASQSSGARSKSMGRPQPTKGRAVKELNDVDNNSLGYGLGAYAARGVSKRPVAMSVSDLSGSDSSNKKKSPENGRRSLTNRIRTTIEKMQCRPPSPEELYPYSAPAPVATSYVRTKSLQVKGEALENNDFSGSPTRVGNSSQKDSQDSPWTKKVVKNLEEAQGDGERITPRDEDFSERPWRHDMVVQRVNSFGGQQTYSVNEDVCQCSSSVFSGNDELIEFFLPLMGMACTCGKRPRGLNNPDDPIALENILRPWQVDFLENFGIFRGDQLVKAHHRSASALSSALRQYRRKKGMTPFRTKSCKMALEIWSKTCKAFVRSIRKQIADGTVDFRLPNTLYILSSFLEKMPSGESSTGSSREPSPREGEFESQGSDYGDRKPSPREEEEFVSNRAEL